MHLTCLRWILASWNLKNSWVYRKIQVLDTLTPIAFSHFPFSFFFQDHHYTIIVSSYYHVLYIDSACERKWDNLSESVYISLNMISSPSILILFLYQNILWNSDLICWVYVNSSNIYSSKNDSWFNKITYWYQTLGEIHFFFWAQLCIWPHVKI